MTTRLDQIAARLEAAMGKPLDVTIHADRPMVTVQTSPEVWELIRGALSADLAALVGAVREVEAARQRSVETGASAMHLRGDITEALDRLEETDV